MWKIKRKEQRQSLLKDKTAMLVSSWLIALQHKAVKTLKRWEGHFNVRQKKIILILLCNLLGTYFLYLLIYAMIGAFPADKRIIDSSVITIPPSIKPPPIAVPAKDSTINANHEKNQY